MKIRFHRQKEAERCASAARPLNLAKKPPTGESAARACSAAAHPLLRSTGNALWLGTDRGSFCTSTYLVNRTVKSVDVCVVRPCSCRIGFDITQTTIAPFENIQRDSTPSQCQSIAAVRLKKNPEPIVVHAIQTAFDGFQNNGPVMRTKINT